MLILVANLGSTSFKYRLLDMEKAGEEVARGGYERIGQPGSYQNHGEVIDVILNELKHKPDAIGFKAVHGGPISGAVLVDDKVLDTMQQFADIAPAHNPPYIAAMKAFAQKLPGVPQVACFETAFHQTIPLARQTYAIPYEWTRDLRIRRYGFHGASHSYIARRTHELMGDDFCGGNTFDPDIRIISIHLGGSSSVCAIQGGQSVANSFGLTPQTGLPQNNRVGDFDAFALMRLLKHGLTVDDVLKKLSKEGGLLGISGVSNDMRELEQAAAQGNDRAALAIDVLAESVRHYLGAFVVAMGGVEAIVFTGGIGENSSLVREKVCANLDFLGAKVDAHKNKTRGVELKISVKDSKVQVWIIPANEEFIVARQTQAVLKAK